MMRILHRWPGLIAAVLLIVISVTGAALAIFPALDAYRSAPAEPGLSVAVLAERVSRNHPGLEEIRRSASGQITAWWFDQDQPGSAVIHPQTGQDIASADPDPLRRWLTQLHRSLFLDDLGRWMTALGAVVMLVLAISGVFLVARQVGGWRRWFSRVQGSIPGRLHTEVARVAVLGLVLSCTTALWMTGQTFDLIQVEPVSLAAPSQVSRQPALPLREMQALRNLPVDSLRELSFPDPEDPADVFTLTTVQGTGYVDPGTGLLLEWQSWGWMIRASETVKMLHTGQGAAALGLILGLMALSVPLLALTGVLIWLARLRLAPSASMRTCIRDNTSRDKAQTIVLVGSESGTTWGFASELARSLRQSGQTVHVAAMNDFAPLRYRQVKRFIILAATYGQGDAPASASKFLHRLGQIESAPDAPLAVLGFGDSSFAQFCAYARTVKDKADSMGWPTLIPFDTIDRQSSQAFARWGSALGQALGVELELAYQPVAPATQALTLIDRKDYGAEVNAPMAILRFARPVTSVWQRLTGQGFGQYEAGDLIGILPPGSDLPRLYSLASSAEDDFIEIVVRRHPHGLASGQLTSLMPGQQIQAFFRGHEVFHAGQGREPLILIGAGTGVGPLAGFIRANSKRRQIHLFFGLRNPTSDFLYRDELAGWVSDGRLSGLHLATSRAAVPNYVQDVVRKEHDLVTRSIRAGAKVMVCGGRQMADGVREAISSVLSPMGMSLDELKQRGLYVEDVY